VALVDDQRARHQEDHPRQVPADEGQADVGALRPGDRHSEPEHETGDTRHKRAVASKEIPEDSGAVRKGREPRQEHEYGRPLHRELECRGRLEQAGKRPDHQADFEVQQDQSREGDGDHGPYPDRHAAECGEDPEPDSAEASERPDDPVRPPQHGRV
jgi:hypothetical protein